MRSTSQPAPPRGPGREDIWFQIWVPQIDINSMWFFSIRFWFHCMNSIWPSGNSIWIPEAQFEFGLSQNGLNSLTVNPVTQDSLYFIILIWFYWQKLESDLVRDLTFLNSTFLNLSFLKLIRFHSRRGGLDLIWVLRINLILSKVKLSCSPSA